MGTRQKDTEDGVQGVLTGQIWGDVNFKVNNNSNRL